MDTIEENERILQRIVKKMNLCPHPLSPKVVWTTNDESVIESLSKEEEQRIGLDYLYEDFLFKCRFGYSKETNNIYASRLTPRLIKHRRKNV